MFSRCLKKKIACLILLISWLIGPQSCRNFVWASPAENSPPKTSSPDSTLSASSWLDQIDMHWGGRLKAIGSATFARDDTIFEPVGTGTYLNFDTDLRINNDTFLGNWGRLEIQYEAILTGGETREKSGDLRKILPNFEGSTLFFGAPLDDKERFMDLTHTIKDDDSYILAQRLDRLNFTFKSDWGFFRVGRQAITWGTVSYTHLTLPTTPYV
jgi:hypothetical protein